MTDMMDDAALEALIADPVRRVEARGRLRDAIDAASNTTTYLHWQQRLPPASAMHMVALLSSFTVRTLEPFLAVESWLGGWSMLPFIVEYAQWQNALLAPGVVPDDASAVVLLLHDTELCSPVAPDAGAAITHLFGLLTSFRQWCPKPLFVGLVAAPPPLPAPGQDTPSSIARRDLAAGLEQLLGQIRDAHRLELPLPPATAASWFDPAAFMAQRTVVGHRAMPAVARCLARSLSCLFRPRRKLLVVDLDNTLWGGVVGEDGVDGVVIGPDYPGAAYLAFQHQLLELRAQGVLLAIASKNNEADAREIFERRPEMVLRWEHFSARRIDWDDKAANIARIAAELGLGLDAVVFADDSGIECARVRAALPAVEVVELGPSPARFVERLMRTQAFDSLTLTDEDRGRAVSYAAEAERKQQLQAAPDTATFLASCGLELAIDVVGPGTLERVHQLLGKTNQFNLTLERPGKEQLQALCGEPARIFSATLKDRFGDYGLVGVLHLNEEPRALRIVNMVLSCRALGRGVEDALLAFARERAQAAGATRLDAYAVRGPRNQQVFDFLARTGFVANGLAGNGEQERLSFFRPLTPGSLPWPPYLTVKLPQEQP